MLRRRILIAGNRTDTGTDRAAARSKVSASGAGDGMAGPLRFLRGI